MKICIYCGKEFVKKQRESYKAFDSRKFCSFECRVNSKYGTRTGTRHTDETKNKISKNRTGKGGLRNEKNPNWKGTHASYSAIHKWIVRKFGTPRHCANCHTDNAKKYEWANLSGCYKRELSDWARLCSKCHINFDKGNTKLEL